MGTAPSIVGPRSAVTRQSSVTLTVELIEDPEGRASVRLYRAERVIAEARVRGDSAVELRDVPLKRGRNIIAATVVSAKGESARSADIVVDRDDAPPELAIGEPAAGSVINAPSVVVRGVSEPAAAVTVTGITRGQVSPVTVPATVAQDGSFEAMVELAVGPNRLSLRATDGAGNETVASLLLIGGDGRPEARLGLTSSLFYIRRLPQTVSLSVRVVDADGTAIATAPVVFSLSPPGQPTSTYRTTVAHGVATWPDVSLPQDGAQPGEGFATAQVTLPDGSILRAVASFEFR